MPKHSEFCNGAFSESIVPPAATFEDTLVLFYGWSEEDADMQISIMLDKARDTFEEYGGSREQLPLSPPSMQEIEADLDAGDSYFCSGFTEQIARITHQYLIGEGEDYEAFAS